MSRRFFKSLVASLISLILVYYGAAGALLRCFHDEVRSDTPLGIVEVGADIEFSNAQGPTADPAELECPGVIYHAESLAGAASSSQSQRWALIVAHVQDFLIPDGAAAGGPSGLWLNALTDKRSSPPFPIDLPRYLFLSVLRI